jgi:FkbH-like protein
VANWETKPENLRRIARTLNIGLDSLVFVDDNPAEREIVRQHLPEVDVLPLPPDPSGYARALSDYLMFETAAFTAEDAAKTEQYRAKALVAELEAGATSIEDFYRSLAMQAITQPFDELYLSRIVQLLGKTNQFNLTTRRYSEQDIRAIMADPDCVHWYLKLRDKFADHGLVSIIIGKRDGDVMEIDIWLMSCRVIGRTVEQELLARLCESALAKGCTRLRGVYVPTAKNAMVKTVYERFGFELVETRDDGTSVWSYDLRVKGPITNAFIERVGGPAAEAA